MAVSTMLALSPTGPFATSNAKTRRCSTTIWLLWTYRSSPKEVERLMWPSTMPNGSAWLEALDPYEYEKSAGPLDRMEAVGCPPEAALHEYVSSRLPAS